MKPRTLFICRGLPGSGKSSIARMLAPYHCYAADDFFELDGDYKYDPSRIGEAHAWCRGRVENDLKAGVPYVAVHNTFVRAWEAKAYLELAEKYGYSVFVVESQNSFGNVHRVPSDAVESMKDRWEPLTGSPMPLWRVVRNRWAKAKGKLKGRYYRWRGR